MTYQLYVFCFLENYLCVYDGDNHWNMILKIIPEEMECENQK